MNRIRALLWKEFIDVRLNPWIFLPAMIAGIVSIIVPVSVAIVVPAVSGESLAESGEFTAMMEAVQQQPALRSLNPEAMVQALIFQQFLLFLILVPVIGSTTAAAHSVVGEKQARTLEPLLATPITALELLIAKELAAFLPVFVLTVFCYVIDVGVVAWLAQPGVVWVLLSARSLAIVFVMGPLVVFAAVQLAVSVSSRVEDERTAQALGSLIILPVVVLFLAPLIGVQLLTPLAVGAVILLLVIVNLVLLRVSIAVFDRESILTRWK
jgi:ABC-2 type transport system permease protein